MKGKFTGKARNRMPGQVTLPHVVLSGLPAAVVVAGALCLALPSSGAPAAGASDAGPSKTGTPQTAAPPSGAAQARPSAVGVQHFATPSGRIVYKMTSTGGGAMNGTITTTWAEHGRRMRQDSQIAMADGPGKSSVTIKSWTILEGQTLTIELPFATPGVRGPRHAMQMKLPANLRSSIMMAGGPTGMSNSGPGKIVGHATILGKPCVVRLVTLNTAQMTGRTKMWMWQDLPLRAEVHMHFKPVKNNTSPKSRPMHMPPMDMTMVATQLDTTVRPEASIFRIPAGYTIRNIGDTPKKKESMPKPTRPKSAAPKVPVKSHGVPG